MLSDPAAPGSIPSFTKIIFEEIFDVAEVYQWRCLEERGEWLKNVDLTHLVLASGKLVLQKILQWCQTSLTQV